MKPIVVHGQHATIEAFCKRFFGVRGGAVAYCPTAMDGQCLFDWWQIVFWTGGGPWMMTYFWRHWLCTGDREFLRERVYPLLGKFAATYLGLLVLGLNGRLPWISDVARVYEGRFQRYMDRPGQHHGPGAGAVDADGAVRAEQGVGVRAGLTPRGRQRWANWPTTTALTR